MSRKLRFIRDCEEPERSNLERLDSTMPCAARLESKAAVTGNLAAPEAIREPSELLFAGVPPPTKEEIFRWKREGKNYKGYVNSPRLLA